MLTDQRKKDGELGYCGTSNERLIKIADEAVEVIVRGKVTVDEATDIIVEIENRLRKREIV